MPIYVYSCINCKFTFERIEKISNIPWQEEKLIECPQCNESSSKKIITSFKIGTGVLDTTGKSGYQTDALTLGKLIDERGIPAEEKRRLRKRDQMIIRQKQYTKELNARAKKYDFSPYSEETP